MGVRRRKGRGFVLAAGVVASLLSAGCAGASQNQTVRLPSAVTHAVAKASAGGFKMTLTMNEDVDGAGAVFSATGSFAPRLKVGLLSLDMQTPSFGLGGSLPIVIANGTIYEHLPWELSSIIPDRKPWLSLKLSQLSALNQLPGLNSFVKESFIFAGPTQYASFLGATSGTAKDLGQATMNGVETTQYKTKISVAKLLSEAPTPDPQAAQQLARMLRSSGQIRYAPIDVWVDQSGGVRRIQTSVKGNYSGHHVSFAIIENIFGYGSAPTPTVPLAANTTDLLSLVQNFGPSASLGASGG